MTSKIKKKQPKFKIFKIKVLSSYLNSIETLDISDSDLKDLNNIGVGKGFDLKFDNKEGLFKVLPSVDIAFKTKNKDTIKLFGLKAEIIFKFIDFEDIIKIGEEETISLPDDLLLNLINISFSTVRGLLFNLSSNTEYDHLILPLTSAEEFKKALNRKEKEDNT
jgi:hypothetical protein